METITDVLILLTIVVTSGAVARMFPFVVPLPLVQIACGAVIGSVAHLRIGLDPHVFFLLFLPPLLFLDGWRIPKEGLLQDKGTILELAFGLVVFTVLGVGTFIHWMIPTIPYPLAFALAAILSPTDPIAVSAISKRIPIPKRFMHILEGESLLNDASGLVCMRFAVAAAITGGFSLFSALGTFFWLAAGGIAIGFGVTWAIVLIKNKISLTFGEETGSQILISLLIPFAAYLVAEHLHCSGILSAVSAGFAMSYAEQSGKAMAVTRVRRNAVWDTVQFTASGIIFVLLGEQLPEIIANAARLSRETGHDNSVWLLVYIMAISLALSVLRFMWVWVSLRFTLFRGMLKGEKRYIPGWRVVAVMSLAGVRGTITLAGIMTLPLVMPDGSPFPARDLAILLAAGVIIFSLVAASIGLPYLLKGLEVPPDFSYQEQEDKARIAAAQAAIKAIESKQHHMVEKDQDPHLYIEVGARIMDLYHQRIEGRMKTGEEAELVRKIDEIERTLRLSALKAEREEIYRMARKRRISDDVARRLVKEIDLLETRLAISTPS